MRILVRCSGCNRQFDASSMKAGSRLRCSCGEIVSVLTPQPRDADVVRCSSCGAARPDRALTCPYCRSDFTIHDQDLQTICPSCCARISDHARFCHHCGTPIVPEDAGFEATKCLCPACGAGHPLHSRALGVGLASYECGRCAGLWLSNEAFRVLSERAQKAADPEPDASVIRRDARSAGPVPALSGPAYRPCAICSKRMNRSNFGRQSGVVIDRCKEHGIWFDASELDAVLRWIKDGGPALAEASRLVEERVAASAARFRVEPRVAEDAWRHDPDSGWGEGGLLPLIVRLFRKGGALGS